MLLSAVASASSHPFSSKFNLFCCSDLHRFSYGASTSISTNSKRHPLCILTTNAFSSSSPISNDTADHNSLQNPTLNADSLLRCVRFNESEGGDVAMASSASAVAAAIREASTCPVECVQRIENDGKNRALVLPSPDFQRLCLEQMDLFRRIIDPDALLSVYVRPAGSYVMDRLELRRVITLPEISAADIVILVSNFSIPTGLRTAEAAISNQQVAFLPECRAIVFPMVKHPFVVGFLVAELPGVELEREKNDVEYLPPKMDPRPWGERGIQDAQVGKFKLTAEQRSNAINITRSLSMAYVMDQKAMLLQQSSWQNNVRMGNLVEQIRGPLSSIRTLSKLLSVQMKRSETSYDLFEDILVQGERIRDTLEELQDAVSLTKANIMRFNEETVRKMQSSSYIHPDSARPQLSNNISSGTNGTNSLSLFVSKDTELPMPPLPLAPLSEHSIRRPCNVSDVLADLVGAVAPLANKQKRLVELHELTESIEVAVEEPALRQALSNLIEGALLRTHVGGKVAIVSSLAPTGGVLVIIDDNGPDMYYMTQMHSLTPFGGDLLSEERIEDNMTWNFVAGLTVAREILESYGCVVRVISPRDGNAALGAGGTRVELWLPFFST